MFRWQNSLHFRVDISSLVNRIVGKVGHMPLVDGGVEHARQNVVRQNHSVLKALAPFWVVHLHREVLYPALL